MSDLQGLLAPKPLLMDIGIRDQCFRIETALPAYRQLERIYRAAGASEKIELDLHANDHGWGGNRSAAFFNKYLEKDDALRFPQPPALAKTAKCCPAKCF